MLWPDLRAEPRVISVPAVQKKRCCSVQLVDGSTYSCGDIGSRATGNDAGSYLVAGPGWGGTVPEGMSRVFQATSDFSLVIFRTQSFGPDDLDTVKAVQAGYKAGIRQGLSEGKKKVDEAAKGIGTSVNGWQVGSAFGDASFYHGDWPRRAAEEAMYPVTRWDGQGNELDGSKASHTITFPKGAFPPVNTFWSVTM